MYALTLHGEDIEALQATEKQKRIITALMKYENPEEHLKEIKDECGFMGTRLLRVHQSHLQEDIHLYQVQEDIQYQKLGMGVQVQDSRNQPQRKKY